MALESLEQEIRILRERLSSGSDAEDRLFVPLADAYRRAGEHDDAHELLREGLVRRPDFASAHVVAGLLYQDMGEAGRAEAAFARVLELDEENVVALDGLACLAAERGDRVTALERLFELRELDATDPTISSRIEALEAAPESEPADAPTAEAELEGEPGPGFELEPGPGVPPPAAAEGAAEGDEVYTRTMAELYVRQGLRGRAIRVYEHLLNSAPGDPELRGRLEELQGLPEPDPVQAAEAPEPFSHALVGTGGIEASGSLPPSEDPPAEDGSEDERFRDQREEVGFPASEATLAEAELTLQDVEPDAAEGEVPPEGRAAEMGKDPSAIRSGPPVGRYFEALLSWVPGAVPIESLAPSDSAQPADEVPAADDRAGGVPARDADPGPPSDDEDEEFREWLRSLGP